MKSLKSWAIFKITFRGTGQSPIFRNFYKRKKKKNHCIIFAKKSFKSELLFNEVIGEEGLEYKMVFVALPGCK